MVTDLPPGRQAELLPQPDHQVVHLGQHVHPPGHQVEHLPQHVHQPDLLLQRANPLQTFHLQDPILRWEEDVPGIVEEGALVEGEAEEGVGDDS